MNKSCQIFILTLFAAVPAAAEIDTLNSGRSLGLEFAPGVMGSLSFMQAGVTLPTIGSSFQIGIKARMCSSLTWATFIDQETGEQASFHPVAAAGIVSFGGSGPIMHGFMRPYGATDILVGYTFTPYDDLIYDCGNLVGPNITFGVFGYFGLELFTSNRMAVFLDAGGGFKTLKPEEENVYAIAASWLGSGFGFKMGIRFYP
ncbi:hypothetical protein JXM67_08330 [candidate division WOR-3 bacterium]|nr:hypothetical protein [candidate division WOR-3 bacterium]